MELQKNNFFLISSHFSTSFLTVDVLFFLLAAMMDKQVVNGKTIEVRLY